MIGDIHIQQIVDRTIEAADLDNDGVLSFDEFVQYVKTANIEQLFSMTRRETSNS